MAIGGFSYRHAAISALAIPSRTFFVAANSNRMSLVFANNNAANVLIFNSGGTALTGVIAVVSADSTLIMPFRDWGDIIKQEIWIGITGGPLTVFAIDLFRLPVEA